MERDDIPAERHLADALRRLNDAAVVPPPDPAREAALMAAFDAERGEHRESKGPALSGHRESKRPALSEHRESKGPALSEHRESKRPALSEHRESKRPALSEHRESKGRDYWHLAAFAAAAAVLMAAGLAPALPGRHGLPPGGTTAPHTPPPARDVRLEPPSEFVIVPDAVGLPPMESGTLVRMEVPIAMLPSLGVTPPASRVSVVTADVIIAQDGLPRAVRVVSP